MSDKLLRVWLWIVLFCTFLLAIEWLTPLHAQSGGGFPSRPQFQSERVGLGQADPGTGNSSILGTLNANAVSSVSMSTGTILVSGLNPCLSNGSSCPIKAPITCTTACSGAALVVGQSLYLIKGGATSRANVTAVSVDPDLQVSSLPAGQYQVDVFANFTGGSAGGYKMEMSNTTGCGGYNGGGYWLYNFTTAAQLEVTTGVPAVATPVNPEPATSHHIMYTNGAANGVMVCWAQNSSNATNTTMQGGTTFGSSSLTLTRIQ